MRQYFPLIFIPLLFLLLLSSCKETATKQDVTIGFSQAMTTDDWRKQMNSSVQIEASLSEGTNLVIEDAKNNVEKQIADIEKFVEAKVDLIIVSPIQSKPLTAVVQKSINAGIPVLIVDRKIEGENYTAYIGADNIEVGRNAAKYIVANQTGNGKIIQIEGLKGSSPAYERSLGFSQIIKTGSNLQIVASIEGCRILTMENFICFFSMMLKTSPRVKGIMTYTNMKRLI